MDESGRYKLFRRAMRGAFQHEIVAEIGNPHLPLLSVFTSKKYRFPWQSKKLVRSYVTLDEILDSSIGSETIRKLNRLTEVEEQHNRDEYKERFDIDDKGFLKGVGKKIFHAHLNADEALKVDIELGRLTYKEIEQQPLIDALAGLRVQQNHPVLKERKPRSLYVAIRSDYASSISFTSSITRTLGGGAGVDVEKDVAGDADVSLKECMNSQFSRSQKSTVAFKCCQVAINEDNTLTLRYYDYGQKRLDEDETDGSAPGLEAAGFTALLVPFHIVREKPELRAPLLAWVKSCPSTDTICFLEELLDNILSAGDAAKTCQLPASWVCHSFTPECLTEQTIALLRAAGVGVMQPPHQEAELQWHALNEDQIDFLSACVRIVSLTDDLNSDQQKAIGDITEADANDLIDLVLAAAAVRIPAMDLADEHRSTWIKFSHSTCEHLAKLPISTTLQSLGIHLAVTSESSALFDSVLLDGGRLQNIAALTYMLCAPL